jgi:CubicO group peptidase (beta-lactamase class C family)
MNHRILQHGRTPSPVAGLGLVAGTIVVLMAAVLPGTAAAQTTPPEPAAPIDGQDRVSIPPDPAVMTAFFDGMIQTHLRDKSIAGATLSVVQGGEVVVARGYGYADVEERRMVSPEETLFRIGSVTKLFTFTAAMQLVEQGLLELDADINEYLDFEVPATYPEPITVADLMTHTGGFQEDVRNLFTHDPQRMVSLADWVRDNYPGRVRPAGTFSSYSNYGVALLGRIVELVSGLEWDDYLESRILEPLEMVRTTGRQPLPDHLAPQMSGGFVPANGGFTAQEFEITVGADPAGSMTSTATDMAKFMLAILGEGQFGDTRILDPQSVRAMTTRRFEHDPRLPGYGLGFYEMSSHGVRIVGHGGDTGWFHSLLALFPDHDLGFFVSYNTSTGAEVSFAPVLHTFLDWRFPAAPPAHRVATTGDLSPLVGNYQFNRVPYTNFQKAAALLSAVTVRADDGILVVRTPFGTMRMIEVAPLLFQEERGSIMVALRKDESGRVTHAFPSLTPMMAMGADAVARFAFLAFHDPRGRCDRVPRDPHCRGGGVVPEAWGGPGRAACPQGRTPQPRGGGRGKPGVPGSRCRALRGTRDLGVPVDSHDWLRGGVGPSCSGGSGPACRDGSRRDPLATRAGNAMAQDPLQRRAPRGTPLRLVFPLLEPPGLAALTHEAVDAATLEVTPP